VLFGAGDFDRCAQKTTECGIQYSDGGQAGYCAISQPDSWPAMLQVNKPNSITTDILGYHAELSLFAASVNLVGRLADATARILMRRAFTGARAGHP
jgi:hypothetical protein